MISNDFVIKLVLDYKEKDGEKVVKKELLVALKGELYFVKFIINPDEDDVEPGVVLGRSLIIETLKFSDQHKKLLESVLLDKLKLNGEVELEEEATTEEVLKSYKAIK
ncbi:hypothetical protein Tco_1290554 [Tanacetum coccineum]